MSLGKLDQWELFWDLLSDAEYQRAIIGLRAGLQLCLRAYRYTIPNQDLASAAIGDFVNWACALDQQLDSTDATYAARRDTDDDGRVLPALRFVRDRQRHQMAVTSSLVFLVQWSDVNPKPAITRTRIYWRPLEGLPEPLNGHEAISRYVTLQPPMRISWRAGSHPWQWRQPSASSAKKSTLGASKSPTPCPGR